MKDARSHEILTFRSMRQLSSMTNTMLSNHNLAGRPSLPHIHPW